MSKGTRSRAIVLGCLRRACISGSRHRAAVRSFGGLYPPRPHAAVNGYLSQDALAGTADATSGF